MNRVEIDKKKYKEMKQFIKSLITLEEKIEGNGFKALDMCTDMWIEHLLNKYGTLDPPSEEEPELEAFEIPDVYRWLIGKTSLIDDCEDKLDCINEDGNVCIDESDRDDIIYLAQSLINATFGEGIMKVTAIE